MSGCDGEYFAADYFAFVDAVEASTRDAKELLLPLLQLEEVGPPWTAARLRRLSDQRARYDAGLQPAIEHVARYEAPLLAYEERLTERGLDFDAFARAMRRFERRFWRERLRESQRRGERAAAPGAEREAFVCRHHRVGAAEIRRLARETGSWDVADIARLTGATTTCGSCRLEVVRLLIDELTAAKAEGAVR